MASANYDLRLEHGWHFHLGEVSRFGEMDLNKSHALCQAGGALGQLDVFLHDNAWQAIPVPHDWMTALPFDRTKPAAGGYKPRETGWYYIAFSLPAQPIACARLVFDGVLGQSVVYVNGTVAVRNFSGYNRFSCEIGDYLLAGEENHIALYVDARTPEGWWYEGAGLYRAAYIQFREALHFDTEDCFLRGELADGVWNAVATLRLTGFDTGSDAVVTACVADAQGLVVASEVQTANPTMRITLPISNARLWSPETPDLYTLTCTLRRGNTEIDMHTAKIGMRSIKWVPDAGMYLNGEHCRIKGICCHQDHEGVGAAVPKSLTEYRVLQLKALGANAYRCAHHAPSEELLEICDRLGMLVMAENRWFSVSEDAMAQLTALVKLARNHPCVFLYSLFNEEPWQAEERGLRMVRKLYALVEGLDDTRAVTAAMNRGITEDKNASYALDVIGVNYCLAGYETCHAQQPHKVMLGTENCPILATRGEYVTDKQQQVYANFAEEKLGFSEGFTETATHMDAFPYIAGCFMWGGFDYRGEPAPLGWPSVLSHWGFMDGCGFRKDTFYLLAAWYHENPLVHIAAHWNHKIGTSVRVCVFTNADTATLLINGVAQEEKAIASHRAEWQVPFEPGVLRVVAYKDGREVSDEIRTAEGAAHLVLEEVTPYRGTDNTRIIHVSVTDSQGTVLPDYAETVHFDAPQGAVLRVGNGDPNSHHAEIATSVKLFHGRAQLIIIGEIREITARCGSMSATL